MLLLSVLAWESLLLVAGAKFERRGTRRRVGAIIWGVVGVTVLSVALYHAAKYSLQGTTQGNGLTGGVPPVRFSM